MGVNGAGRLLSSSTMKRSFTQKVDFHVCKACNRMHYALCALVLGDFTRPTITIHLASEWKGYRPELRPHSFNIYLY